MSGKNSVVSMTLQLNGKQAQQVLLQFLQTQKTSAAEILKTNRNLEGVLRQQAQQTSIQAKQYQQMSKLVQQQHTALAQSTVQTQATLRTNQLLERVLQQQVRQSTLLTQNNRNQNRDYQLQLNILRQQVAAAERLRQQLEQAGRANREMGNGIGGGFGGGRFGMMGGVATGAMAAYSITKNPIDRARSFETKIFDANTSVSGGYANMTHEQVVATNLRLANYAKDAVRQGHGTVEGVGDAAGILAASGLYNNVDELRIPLLATAKTAFANGAAEQDVALLTQQIRQFGVKPEQTQVALDRASASGFNGGFELRDMAQFLPAVLPYAKTAGYSGEEGLNQVTTHMQLARKYTGLPSQAADNMRDLYSLFSQNHFALSIGKYIKAEEGDPMKKIGLRGNRIGFDINTYLANKKLEGVDTVTAVVQLMNRQLSKNKKFVELQQQINSAEKAGDENQANTLKKEAMGIVAAGEFGKIFHNQQSLSGLMSIIAGLNNGDLDRISKASWDGVGSVDRVAKEKGLIEPAQAHALEQETILGTIKLYDQVKGKLGELEGSLHSTMVANQGLAAASIAAAGALTVLAAAGVGAKMAGGFGAGGGAAAGAAGGAAMGAMRTAGQVGLAGVLGYGVGTAARNMYMQTDAGQAADNWMGEKITQVLAAFGNDNAQAALDAQAKYDEMIQQQQEANQQNAQVIRELQKLPSAIGNSIKIPAPSFNSLQQTQQNVVGDRQGAVPFMLQKH